MSHIEVETAFSQSLPWSPQGEKRSLHKYQAVPETAAPPDLGQGGRWERYTILIIPTKAAQCKQSLVLGSKEEDAAWCEVVRKRKGPLLAPRRACVTLPHTSPYREEKAYLVAWVHESLPAERIQVIHPNLRSFCPLKVHTRNQRFTFYQPEQRPKVSSKIKDYPSKQQYC